MLNEGELPDKAWEMVKDVRNDEYFIKSQTCGQKHESYFFPIAQIKGNFDKIISFMDSNASYDTKIIPKETLVLAGEMFVFLNSCPSPLVSFYHHILQKSSTEMLIALNQQKKIAVSPTSQEIANILYKKLESLLGFNNNKPNQQVELNQEYSSFEGKSWTISFFFNIKFR